MRSYRRRRPSSGRRLRRSRRGLVSAVATLFGLLLVVSFISSVLVQVPIQMAQNELQHQLSVQNQMGRLQQTILASEGKPWAHLPLVTGIRLGSDPFPPFAGPSSGALTAQTSPNAGSGLSVRMLVQLFPIWHNGSSCAGDGNGTCSGSGAGPIVYYNQSGSHIVIHPGLNGCGVTGCGLFYNITGNNDYIGFTTVGNNLGPVSFVIYGNNDTMAVNYSGNCNNHRAIDTKFFGVYDTWTMNVNGCGSGGGGINANVTFVGISPSGTNCPFGDVTSHDRILPLGLGSAKNVLIDVEWFNSLGTTNGPNTVSLGGTNSIEFENSTTASGTYPCAFYVIAKLPFNEAFNGILVHLANRYLAPSDVVYQGGAVLSGSSSGSVMIAPPSFTIAALPGGGLVANLRLVQLVGGFPTVYGTGTEGVITQVLSQHTFSFTGFVSPLLLNVTTAYPQAWSSFFASANSTAFPSGAVCLGSGSQCVTPAPGTLVTLSATMVVQKLLITVALVQLSL